MEELPKKHEEKPKEEPKPPVEESKVDPPEEEVKEEPKVVEPAPVIESPLPKKEEKPQPKPIDPPAPPKPAAQQSTSGLLDCKTCKVLTNDIDLVCTKPLQILNNPGKISQAGFNAFYAEGQYN